MKRLVSASAVILTVLLLAFSLSGAEPRTDAPAVPAHAVTTIAEAFEGEELVYRIGFWLFDNVAVGTVTLHRDGDGTYVGTLKAHTTGMVDRLILSREDTYVSRMRLSDDGQRFVSVSFEKSVNKGGKVRQGKNVFDYERNVMVSRSWGGGKDEKKGEYPFPEEITPADPIAAFYNFRFGAYGPIEKGGDYVIHSFPKEDRVPLITIRIAPEDEARRRSGSYSGKTEYLADARIDKELFDSKSGDIEIYFNGGMVPVGAVAKDLLFLGDVRGSLTRSRLAGEKKVAYKTVLPQGQMTP